MLETSSALSPVWSEFESRWDGMRHALSGGLWLHRFRLNGEPMAHLVSSDRDAILRAGCALGLQRQWVQFKPLCDVDTGEQVDCWHWDLLRERLSLALELAAERAPLTIGRPRP